MNDANLPGAIEPPRLVGRMLLAAILAAVAGLMFGLDIGVISGALSFIQKAFRISDATLGFIVASMTLGAAAGALVAGRTSAALGRRASLIISGFAFVVGALCCAFAQTVAEMVAGRIVLGVAIGIASFVAPLYISEIADESRRGRMISLYQLMITSGILLAFLSDAVLAYYGAWRWMLGIVAIPGVVFVIGAFFLPSSPRWLVLRGRMEEAVDTLTHLRGSREHALSEAASIRASVTEKQRGVSLLRENPNFRRSVLLGIALQLIQQLTGINIVMYYAPRIFEVAGFGQSGQLWGTATIGLVNVLATFIAIGFADSWGRRSMLLTGFVIMAAGMGALAWLLSLGHTNSDLVHYLAVAVLLCFVMGFAFSAGPMIWILCAEIQPLEGRDFGIACSTFTNWAANYLVGQTFLILLDGLGAPRTFWLYAAFNAVFILFTLAFVPETRGVALEVIERNLYAGKRLRDIGR